MTELAKRLFIEGCWQLSSLPFGQSLSVVRKNEDNTQKHSQEIKNGRIKAEKVERRNGNGREGKRWRGLGKDRE